MKGLIPIWPQRCANQRQSVKSVLQKLDRAGQLRRRRPVFARIWRSPPGTSARVSAVGTGGCHPGSLGALEGMAFVLPLGSVVLSQEGQLHSAEGLNTGLVTQGCTCKMVGGVLSGMQGRQAPHGHGVGAGGGLSPRWHNGCQESPQGLRRQQEKCPRFAHPPENWC